jgi:transcriptional regulator with XRE-family HTH domain
VLFDMSQAFGQRLRLLRREHGLTLRGLAEAAGVDFTYLSKIENGKPGYMPGAGTIRALAEALGANALELLELGKKMPPELEPLTSSAQARRFFARAQEIASPDDWEALLKVLDRRQKDRDRENGEGR